MHHHHHIELLEQLLERLLGALPGAWREFTVHFLLDSAQVFLLLVAVMMLVSFLQTYIPFDKMQKRLAGLGGFWGYSLALLMGTLSPFCSCTVIPVLIGLLHLGVPVGVCICFLTSASLLNVGALVSLFTAMDGGFFWAYLTCAAAISLAGPFLFSLFRPERGVLVESDPHRCCGKEGHHHHHHHGETPRNMGERLRGAWENTADMLCQSWLYILAGVGLSSAAVAFIPMEVLSRCFEAGRPGVLAIAVLSGAAIHSDVYSVLPVLKLVAPLSLPVSVGFTLGVMAISIPEAVLLLRVFRGKYVALYSGILTGLALVSGLLLTVIF